MATTPAPKGRPSSIEEAEEFIQKLRWGRGHLSPEEKAELEKADKSIQNGYRELQARVQEIDGMLPKIVVNEILNSPYSFIFELLQNADDAEYGPEDDAADTPELKFLIQSDNIIVDCNQKAFTFANVQAICSTFKSSKGGDDRTTGEKGIGFKSVFGIAAFVHIQSGFWSFGFEHQKGGDGAGMVTPSWIAPEQLPKDVGTRITLKYHPDTNDDLRKALAREFENIPDSILFATRKIARRREYSADEDQANTYESEIMLGFEVDSQGCPIIPKLGQYTFAFLPIERLACMPFLVQGDFILLGNRQQVKQSNPWNEGLLRGVAQGFCEAMKKFISLDGNTPLSYRWLSFLRVYDSAWYTSFMKLIANLWQDKNCRPVLGPLRLLPLGDGTWDTLESAKSVYTPFAVKEGDVKIGMPTELDIKFLHPEAYGKDVDVERRKAFEPFDISMCDRKLLVQKILGRHDRGEGGIRQKLADIEVPCTGDVSKPLKETILPTDIILNEAKELTLQAKDWTLQDKLPILKLPGSCLEATDTSWHFLQNFGVVCDVNLRFYICALQAVNSLDSDAEHVHNTYQEICKSISYIASESDVQFLKESFNSKPSILVPGVSEWRDVSDCVWDGPPGMQFKTVLKHRYGASPEMQKLFVGLLGMGNASCKEIIDELIMIDDDTVPADMQQKLSGECYACLAELIEQKADQSSNIEYIRGSFEKYHIIYIPNHSRWYLADECVWGTDSIGSRAPLANAYPDLERFFVDTICVPRLTLELMIDELIQAATCEDKNAKTIKELMKSIGEDLAKNPSAEISTDQLKTLDKSAFLPIRNGAVFKKPTEEFFIDDHERYSAIFRTKVDILDFSCKELPSLHGLFVRLKIHQKYLSKHVKVSAEVKEPSLNEKLSVRMKRRAYALSCCAIYYHSPQYANENPQTHELLLTAQVFLCQSINAKVSLSWHKDLIEADSGRATAKIINDNNGLQIYLPLNEDAICLCFSTELPGKLMDILEVSDSKAKSVISRILNDETRSPRGILLDEDIPSYKWPTDPDLGEDDFVRRSAWVNAVNEDPEGLNVDISPVPPVSTNIHQEVPNVDISPVPPVFANIDQEVLETERYKIALKNIVQQARDPCLAGLFQELDQIDSLDNRWTTENKAWIGAAGELYVFERLCGLGITPAFTTAIWRSRIRHHISSLDEYKGLEAFQGREEADIMCLDTSGKVAKFITQNTSHPAPGWLSNASGRQIEYLIEVKATSRRCETPFFVSGHQYDLMRKNACSNTAPSGAATVYLLARVYNLFSNHIGLEVYIDPWHLKDNVLDFRADVYTVTRNALALGVSTASAYLDTSPFFMFSTSELLNGATKISTAEAVTSEISQSLSRCPSDYYILVSQPGVTTDDYRSRRTSSSLSQYVAGKTGGDSSVSNNIRSSLSIPEVIGTVDVSALAKEVAQACEIAQVDIDATAGSIPAVLPSGRSVVTVQLAAPLGLTREHDLSQNDGLFASLLDLIPSSASYTVVYTTSTDSMDKNEHRQGTASDITQQSSLHLDLKRGTKRQPTRRSSSDKDDNTLVDGPLFHRYQFFTPGIFMGFLVGFILLLILYVGISALASLQVTYAAFDKEQGQLAPKKVQ
ncbi:hypothetical protein DV738_g2630, partial [Chaetothyriales sp. CBS 135597]